MTALPPDIAAAIARWPTPAKTAFRAIRDILFRAAADQPAVGALTETLKWGEPAYLTAASKSGTTVRLAWKPATPAHLSVLLHCRTTLIGELRDIYPHTFIYQGTRAALVRLDAPLPLAPLDHLARMAQMYHRRA